MNAGREIHRRDFLQGLLHPLRSEALRHQQPTFPMSMLPPEFSGAMLRLEVSRMGMDPGSMTEEEMAELVLHAMQGSAQQDQPAQEHPAFRGEKQDSMD